MKPVPHADILILGYTLPTEVRLLAENDIIQSVFSEEYAETLHREAGALGVKLRVHIKLDTGMNRIGIPAATDKDISEAIESIRRISALSNLSPEGLFTHFASADEPDETAVTPHKTELQYERFCRVDKGLSAAGIDLPVKHVCNTAAALRFPAFRGNLVRVGISLYGIYPSDFFSSDRTGGETLSSVLQLKTRVVHLHDLHPGETVSYGGHYSAPSERRIATIPIGYADGFRRSFTGVSVTVVTKTGRFSVPVIGNVCMDQCMLDVTGIPVALGDEVILFGDRPSALAELARRAGTIPYECLCNISARIPLVYRDADIREPQKTLK